MNNRTDADKAILMAAFAKIDVIAFAAAMGAVFAVLLFLATAILVLKGAAPGTEVGPHLQLLGVYLPGYTVSWSGSLLGGLYGGLLGAAFGVFIAVLWNLTHLLYITLIVIRTAWFNLMAD
jgi:hypothetical protein